ncbi:uncharacterized protein LOC141900891 [Tubulanus polymorphus]|uniref:uncharacterized protein LOC141900891 n=1 Tax=Tubulanus polymorphus TaxID=672921 RepID=UPI003DA2D752
MFSKKFRRKKSRAEGGTSDEASVDDFELQQIELELELEKQLKQERTRRQWRKFKNCCKTAWTFLFSHIGLSGLVVGYSIMGGLLFQALEAPNEEKTNVYAREHRNKTVSKIVRKAIDLEQIRQDMISNYSKEVDTILQDYQKYVFRAVKSEGWDGEDNSELKWSYAGALLFAVTVITTIGYGHVAPKTKTGRVATILYALIGIPLTFLCLANIGDFLADCFRMLYARVCCGVCCICFRASKQNRRRRAGTDVDPENSQQHPIENDTKANKKGKKKKTKKEKTNKDEAKGGKNAKDTPNRESTLTETSLLEHCEENHVETPTDFADLFYQYDEFKSGNLSLEDTKILLKDEDILISVNELLDCKETDLTNGFGESNPEQEAKTPEEIQEEETARRARLRRNRSNRRKRNRRKDKRWKSDTEAMFALAAAGEESGGSASGSAKHRSRNLDRISALKHTKSVDIEVEHKSHKEQKVRVPIVLCLLLIAGYVFFGSILFARWEGWDYLTGSYFCFVTLSTIGFGDIVPGMKLGSWASQEKLVACALYLAFGLSVLAMCFNLMQEEVKEKCRWVGRKVGILSSEPD